MTHGLPKIPQSGHDPFEGHVAGARSDTRNLGLENDQLFWTYSNGERSLPLCSHMPLSEARNTVFVVPKSISPIDALAHSIASQSISGCMLVEDASFIASPMNATTRRSIRCRDNRRTG